MGSKYRILGNRELQQATNPSGGVALGEKYVRLSREMTGEGVRDVGLHVTVRGRAFDWETRKVRQVVGAAVYKGDPNSTGVEFVAEGIASTIALINANSGYFEV